MPAEFHTLKAWRAAMTRPVLARVPPLVVAQCGEHTVQFDCDEAARFFVGAYDALPGIFDALQHLREENDRLSKITVKEDKLRAAEETNAELRAKIAELQTELVQAAAAIARGRQAARTALRAQARARDAARHAAELQLTLNREREEQHERIGTR